MNPQHVTLRVLLDLNAAFDTDFAKTLEYELRYTWKGSRVVFIVLVRAQPAHFV